MNSAAFALCALVPLIVGTTPHDAATQNLTVALCNGGEITIDLGLRDEAPQPDCHQKACHAGACREKHKTRPVPAS